MRGFWSSGNVQRLGSDDEGFSLVEMLVVVAILGIILALAVPNLIRSRHAANGASAIASLRTINTAEYLYEHRYSGYGTLTQLVPEGTLDTNLNSGNKSGYVFTLAVSADLKHFTANADPISSANFLSHYFIDESSIITAQVGAPASVTSTPIQ